MGEGGGSIGSIDVGSLLGLLDDDPGVTPQLHIWVENKAPWFTITDNLPQKPKGPNS